MALIFIKPITIGNNQTTTDHYELAVLGFAKSTTFYYELGGMGKTRITTKWSW